MLCASAAQAADQAGNYAIWGIGARSCHQFERSAATTAERDRFAHYLMGYLTATNALAPETYSVLGDLTLEGALTWLDDYCGAHPIESFERAASQLVVARHAARQQVPPGTPTASGWGRAPAP